MRLVGGLLGQRAVVVLRGRSDPFDGQLVGDVIKEDPLCHLRTLDVECFAGLALGLGVGMQVACVIRLLKFLKDLGNGRGVVLVVEWKLLKYAIDRRVEVAQWSSG